MKKDDLIDSLGRIDDDLIQGADALRRVRKHTGWKRWAGLAACFCLLLAAAAAIPGILPEKPPVQTDFPLQTDPKPTEQTTQPDEPAPVWTAIYNDAVSKLSAQRTFIRGIFSEELSGQRLAAVVPEGTDCSGYAVFDDRGGLLDVILTVHTQTPVTVTITNYVFDSGYLLDGEAVVSVCGDVQYRLYQYAYGDRVTLGADAVIGGIYFDFCLESSPEELEQAKADFQTVLESFASYPEGRPDLSAIVPEKIPELTEKLFDTLSEARTEPDFGGYLPAELPDGFAESAIRRFRFGESNYLSALWSRGLDDLSWVVRPYKEADASRLTGVDQPENYDLSRYPIPRADSVPEDLREIVDDPIFDAEELTLDAVMRRAYKIQDAGDTDGWRMQFSVRCGEVLVSINAKGVEPQWLYEQLKGLLSGE